MSTLLAAVVILRQDGRFRRATLSCRGAPHPRTQPVLPWSSLFPDPVPCGSGNIMLQCGNHVPLDLYPYRPAAGWNVQPLPFRLDYHTSGRGIAEPAPVSAYFGR